MLEIPLGAYEIYEIWEMRDGSQYCMCCVGISLHSGSFGKSAETYFLLQ